MSVTVRDDDFKGALMWTDPTIRGLLLAAGVSRVTSSIDPITRGTIYRFIWSTLDENGLVKVVEMTVAIELPLDAVREKVRQYMADSIMQAKCRETKQ